MDAVKKWTLGMRFRRMKFLILFLIKSSKLCIVILLLKNICGIKRMGNLFVNDVNPYFFQREFCDVNIYVSSIASLSVLLNLCTFCWDIGSAPFI